MRRNLSDQEFHALYCPLRNTKSALVFVASFSLVAFVGWKGLHKAPVHHSYVDLIFVLIWVAILAKLLVVFTCFRERLVLSLVVVSMVTGEVNRFAPSVFGYQAEAVKFGKFALSLLCLLVSLTMLAQSARIANVGPSNGETSIAWKPIQILLILLAVTLTILVLGTLLYFLPFRQ